MGQKKNKTTRCGQLIRDLSGMDPKFRQSSKFAAFEIVNGGPGLFDIVLRSALSGGGYEAERCAEACARAAVIKPELAENVSKKIIDSVLLGQSGPIRYYLSVMLINVKVPEAKAGKCARVISGWLKKETGRGAKAAFLEAIAYLAAMDTKLRPFAVKYLNEALKSDVPSYSARARQIIMRMGKKLQ